MERYPLFRKENIPAYATVMAVWALISLVSAASLSIIGTLRFPSALVWSAVTTMLGMGIMFVASLINLTKMRPGFERLARGEADPNIPPVWCPVLTAATNAAMELAEKSAAYADRQV